MYVTVPPQKPLDADLAAQTQAQVDTAGMLNGALYTNMILAFFLGAVIS